MQQNLDTVISRLEGVAARLEAAEGRLSGGQVVAALSPSQASSPTSGDVLAAWDALVAPAVSSFQAAAQPLGDELVKASNIVDQAFKAERGVIEASSHCQKPDMGGLQAVVAPVVEQMAAANALTEGRRTAAFNHFKVVAEALHALSWLVYSGPGCGMSLPAQHVDEGWQSAEFWANKVLMEFRNTDANHVTWVKALKSVFEKLREYVKKHHATGLSWNAHGGPVSSYQSGAGPAAPSAAKPVAAARAPPPQPRGPPPAAPPPPPPGSLFEKAASKAGSSSSAPQAGMSAVFAELSKGEGVTAGLKKVTADMKAKNQAGRSGAVPSTAATAGKPAADGKSSRAGPRGPPRIELEQGRKWVVENQEGNRNIVISDTNPKQTVYVYNCHNSTVQVRGKINAISVDACSRSGLLFEDLLASCEVVNSSSIEVQCTGIVPTVAVDKCDGVQLYLSEQTLELVNITTAKASVVNVVVAGATPEADLVEHAIPEQFVSTFRQGKFVTEAVSHGGG
ncbi:hypothetical protein WJX72_001921 [[Myrmecia] bisecta]|uniref:C-CAP/cofactor C-like domain-containing protein n=1 Tax=[Myrmecia] bisecta TaxID=41462 RepID=A0AAW1QEH0_9CHLO